VAEPEHGTVTTTAKAPGTRRQEPPVGLRVIWNTNAGSKAGLPTNGTDPSELREVLLRHRLGDDIVPTATEAEARTAVREAIEAGCRPIVAAGGDGTAYLVADELVGTDIPLGILPLGSAMNLARGLGIPRDLEGAAAVLATGNERAIDIGEAAGRRFYEAVSIGLSAQILGAAHALDTGRYRSVLELIGVLRRTRRVRIRLRADGQVFDHRAIAAVVANMPYTGLALDVAPDARLDDGLLDVRVYRQFSRLELLRHFWSIAFGRRAYAPKVATYRAREVSIETRGLPCRADDFDLGRTPLVLTVRPHALRVIAPPMPATGTPPT
jgi:diacylglycerol kinase (ATP)